VATVKTKEIYIEPMAKKWRQKIDFDSKTGRFSITMPKEYQAMFPASGSPTAKTLEDVEREFRDAIYRWKEAAIKIRKVILYRFAVSIPSGRNDFESSFENHPEHAVGFQWEVCRERTVGTEIQYFQINVEDEENEGHELFIHRPYIQRPDENEKGASPTMAIDWTPEREKFFESMETGIKHLVSRVVEFERQIRDPKVLDRLVASGTFLLMAAAKETT
jgi:hypothetical protein